MPRRIRAYSTTIADRPARSDQESNMRIPFPVVIVGSLLLATAAMADSVPKYDMARTCRLDHAAASGLAVTGSMKSCVRDEKQAFASCRSNGRNIRRRSGRLRLGKTPSAARREMSAADRLQFGLSATSSPRRRGPIRPVSSLPGWSKGLLQRARQGLWVPAFAGTAWSEMRSRRQSTSPPPRSVRTAACALLRCGSRAGRNSG